MKLAGPAVLAGGSARAWTAYVLVIVLGISLFVAAHYYKIVPFLVWYHRFGPLVGIRKVPKVAELFSERVALVNGGLLVVGWLGLALGTYLGAPRLAQAAALHDGSVDFVGRDKFISTAQGALQQARLLDHPGPILRVHGKLVVRSFALVAFGEVTLDHPRPQGHRAQHGRNRVTIDWLEGVPAAPAPAAAPPARQGPPAHRTDIVYDNHPQQPARQPMGPPQRQSGPPPQTARPQQPPAQPSRPPVPAGPHGATVGMAVKEAFAALV